MGETNASLPPLGRRPVDLRDLLSPGEKAFRTGRWSPPPVRRCSLRLPGAEPAPPPGHRSPSWQSCVDASLPASSSWPGLSGASRIDIWVRPIWLLSGLTGCSGRMAVESAAGQDIVKISRARLGDGAHPPGEV